MEDDIIDFLEQSNFIEGVRDGLDQSVKAWKYIIQKDILTKDIILKTHKILMRKQPLKMRDRGVYRKHNVMLTRREIVGVDEEHILSRQIKVKDVGCDWKDIQLQMDIWIGGINNSLHSKYLKTNELKKEATIGMHINFEGIHPFADGNGRMGRILLNWQLQKMNLPILIIKEEDRFDYYKWFN